MEMTALPSSVSPMLMNAWERAALKSSSMMGDVLLTLMVSL